MNDADWDLNTRLFHWGLALTLTFQMVSGLYVSTPGTLEYFHMHEAVGLVAATIILFHWLWSYAAHDMGILFPWNRAGMAGIRADLTGLRRGRLPAAGRTLGLSGFTHGLGLLAMSGMAATGFLIYLVIPGGQGASAVSTDYGAFTNLSLMHKALSQLAWAYLAGHVGFALLHQLRGHRVFGAIFAGGTTAGGED